MHRNVVLNAALAFVVVGIGLVALSLGNGVVRPCRDDLAFQGPTTEVDVTTYTAENVVEVTHVGGDILTEEWTLSVTAVASTADDEATTRYALANRSEGLPLEPGDSVRIEDVTIDGESLSSGDTVRIVWRGHQRPLPGYCLASRENATARMTVAISTVA